MRRTENYKKRLAIILAKYPNKDRRLGNGVGLDTTASVVAFLKELEKRGYVLVTENEGSSVPENGDELMRILQEGITNDEEMNYGKNPDQSIYCVRVFAMILTLPE